MVLSTVSWAFAERQRQSVKRKQKLLFNLRGLNPFYHICAVKVTRLSYQQKTLILWLRNQGDYTAHDMDRWSGMPPDSLWAKWFGGIIAPAAILSVATRVIPTRSCSAAACCSLRCFCTPTTSGGTPECLLICTKPARQYHCWASAFS